MGTLSSEAHLPMLRLVTRCHDALVRTRGVALGLASLEWSDETLTWLSIGNVAGFLVRVGRQGTLEREYVLMRNGVVGARLPPLRAATLPLQRHDLLVFATDGVREGFQSEIRLDAPPQVTADRILARYARPTDDALVLVGRWNGPNASEAK
jgi:negative regulator of sigma-B (phosphoserine phosphatase)